MTLLIDYLRNKITATSRPYAVVEMAIISMYFTVDIITRLAFGEELGFLSSDSDKYNLLADTRRAVRILWLPLVDSHVRAITTSRAFIRLFGKKSILGVVQRYTSAPTMFFFLLHFFLQAASE